MQHNRDGACSSQENSEIQDTPEQTRKAYLKSLTASPTTRGGHPSPLVSIIVLNYNGAAVLERCLTCLGLQTYSNYEIILVDNGSTDSSLTLVDELAAALPLRILALGENYGVAGGRNRAVEIAKGEVLAFIDNDGYADTDWLERSLETLYSDAAIGAVAPAVFFSWDAKIINGMGGGMDRSGYGCDYGYNQHYQNFKPESRVLYPMGCGMVVHTATWRTIGPLDESLPKWYDDTELGVRIWNAGQTVVVACEAIVDHQAHQGDQTREPHAWKRALLFEKARIRMVLKYFPLFYFPVWMLNEISTVLKDTVKNGPGSLAVWLMACVWNIFHFRSALHFRDGGIFIPRPSWALLERQSLKSDDA